MISDKFCKGEMIGLKNKKTLAKVIYSEQERVVKKIKIYKKFGVLPIVFFSKKDGFI